MLLSFVVSLLYAVAFSPLSSATSVSQWIGPRVRVKNGTLEGVYNHAYHQDFFLGIPYAAPPVGDLRFRLPEPAPSWSKTKNVHTYGAWCMSRTLHLPGFSQNVTGAMSEDCLTLNVVRPAGYSRRDKLPVLAWIHGGGYVEGGSADGRYNGSFLVQQSVEMGTPLIFVSFNFRLGVFGHLSGPEIREAGVENIALHDQRQALRWIQDNILQFGGDPSRVTIMGESAGATSVGGHLLAFGGRDDGLFSAAIAESGGPIPFFPIPNENSRAETFRTVLNTTNCTNSAEPLSCLRAVSAEDLNSAVERLGPAAFSIVPDDMLLPEVNSQLVNAGRFVKVPLLIGSNRNEGTAFLQAGGFLPQNKNLTELIQFFYGTALTRELVQRWDDLYQEEIKTPSVAGLGTVLSDGGSATDQDYGKNSLWLGDWLFTAGRRHACQAWADRDVPCYSYLFDVGTANVDRERMGVAHFQEIPFVFGNVDGVGWEVSPYPHDQPEKNRLRAVAREMSRRWINFAVTQSPNSRGR